MFPGGRRTSEAAVSTTIRIYGISSMALKDWGPFRQATGLDIEYTPVTYDTGVYIRDIVANEAGSVNDILMFTGNTPDVLGPQGFYLPLDESHPNLTLWDSTPDSYKRTSDCVGKDGVQYGVPIVNNEDSFGFWPDAVDAADPLQELSWELVFESPKTRGRVALDTSVTYSMSVMAQWLKTSGQANIGNPGDLTPEEAKVVADYGIGRKRAGQFRTFFSSLDEQIALLGNREVDVLNCWEPCVNEVNKQAGKDVVFYAFAEYYYQWGDAAYIPSQAKDRGNLDNIYKALNFFLGASGAYRAIQARDRSYGGPNMDLGVKYAEEQGWSEEEVENLRKVADKIIRKFKTPAFWGVAAPENKDVMEEEWQRFLNA